MAAPVKNVKEVLEDFVRICDTAKPMEFLSELGRLSGEARKTLDAANQTNALDWAVRRWNEEVKSRPLINIHRRTLDDTWRQIIRKAGGNDRELVGPTHDELVAEMFGLTKEGLPQPNEHQQAWLDGQKECGIDPVPLTKEGVVATIKSLQSGQTDELKEERKLTDDLVNALTKLLNRDERNTCQHEETYSAGAAWTYCSTCNMKWADSQGGTPKFDEPTEWTESYAALDNVRKQRDEATEGSGS